MKILSYTLCLLLLCSQAVAQQPVPVVVTRSTQVMTDGSNRYYVHQVKRGETVYSISRAYGISEEELLRENPAVEGNIVKADMWLKILIPPQEELPPAPAPAPPLEPKGEVIILNHEVKRKETLFTISNMYEVDIDDIRQYNLHIFPDGKGSRVRAKQVLYIPISLSGLRRGGAAAQSEELRGQCDSARRMYVVNAALMLPFNADQQDNPSELLRSFRFLEVYEGALLALEDLRRKGLSVNLSVFDVKPANLSMVLRSPALANADLIIGPVYPNTFKPVAEFARQRNIKIVSPLVAVDSSLYGFSNVFQVPVDFDRQVQQTLVHSKVNPSESNIILVSQRDEEGSKDLRSYYRQYLPKADSITYRNTPGRRDSLEMDLLQKQYEAAPHTPVVKNLSYKIGLQPRENHEVFLKIFTPHIENKVVVASQDEPFVSELLTNLKAFSDRYKCYITVYGLSSWKKFDNIDLRLFYDLKLHLAAPYYISYKSSAVKSFVQSYREKYKTEPSQFAFQGYDIMMYFASALYFYGKDFERCLPLLKVPLLQSNYAFSPIYQGGAYENKGVFLLRYTPWMEIVQYQ